MEKNRIHALRFGDTTRMSYSKINEVLDMPNLIEVQKDSYQWFLKEGLKEVFEDISPITDFSGNLVLESSILHWIPNPNSPLKNVKNVMPPMRQH